MVLRETNGKRKVVGSSEFAQRRLSPCLCGSGLTNDGEKPVKVAAKSNAQKRKEKQAKLFGECVNQKNRQKNKRTTHLGGTLFLLRGGVTPNRHFLLTD